MYTIDRVAERKLQIVATRGRVMGDYTQGGGGGTNYTRFESRIRMRSAPVYVRDVRFLYSNFIANNTSSDADAPNDITVEACIESISGVFARRAFMHGSTTKTIAAGAHYFLTDKTGADLAPSTDFAVRTGVTVSAGQFVQYGVLQLTTSDQFAESTSVTSQVQGTGNMTSNGGALVTKGYGPLAAVGYPLTPTPACVIRGDSIGVGVADVNNNVGANGLIERGLVAAAGGAIPFMNLARAGDSLQGGLAIGHHWRRDSLCDLATHCIYELGNNDPSGGVSLANMQSFATSAWKSLKARGLKIYATTLTPRTDAGNTAVIANYEWNGVRGLYNTWLFTQIGNTIDGVIDLNVLAEDPARPGFWANSSMTADGIHPNQATNILLAPLVTAVVNRWQ